MDVWKHFGLAFPGEQVAAGMQCSEASNAAQQRMICDAGSTELIAGVCVAPQNHSAGCRSSAMMDTP